MPAEGRDCVARGMQAVGLQCVAREMPAEGRDCVARGLQAVGLRRVCSGNAGQRPGLRRSGYAGRRHAIDALLGECRVEVLA